MTTEPATPVSVDTSGPQTVGTEPESSVPVDTPGSQTVGVVSETSPTTVDPLAARGEGFQRELEQFTGPKTIADGALAGSTEFQDLLTRMREAGIYTPESIDAIEADALSFDRQRVSDTIATLPPELRSVALSRINQGEDPFAVLRENEAGAAAAATRVLEQYRLDFREYTGEESTGDLQRDRELWDKESSRRESLVKALNAGSSIGKPEESGRLDTQETYDRLAAEYAAAFKAYTGRDPTFDVETDEKIIDEATARRAGPDVGLRPPRELLAGSLADVATDRPASGPVLDNAVPQRAPIVAGPDVAVNVQPGTGPLAGVTAQPQAVG